MQRWPGCVLAAARALTGLSIDELAGRAGVSVNTIRRIEAAPVVEVTGKQSRAGREEGVYRVSEEVFWRKLARTFHDLSVELVPATSEHGTGVRLLVKPKPLAE